MDFAHLPLTEICLEATQREKRDGVQFFSPNQNYSAANKAIEVA